MTITVTELGDNAAEAAAWEDYVARHDDATVYHRLAWREIFRRGFGYRSWLLVARDASNAVRGVLPLYLVPAPFRRRLVAVPFRDRGGPLWDTEAAFNALVAAAREIAVRAGAATVRLKTIRPYDPELVRANSLHEHIHWVHSVVDLRGFDADAYWREIGDKNRNMIRQGERHGLAFEPLTFDEPGMRQWHQLHLATQKRLGLPPFPVKFFHVMSEALAKAGAIAMFGVRRGENLEAATIVLLHGKTAIYGYSASSGEGQHHRANDLMICNMMRWAIENRYDRFDLGSDSPAQDSLLFFKSKWLAAQSPIPIYTTNAGDRPVVDSSDRKYALARKAFALLPAGVLNAGSFITRYFG